jgi:hypothetical protein
MIVPASGYRPKAAGGHYNTFLALETADRRFAKLSAYFDGCRKNARGRRRLASCA